MINYNWDALDSYIIFEFLHSKYVIGDILKKYWNLKLVILY